MGTGATNMGTGATDMGTGATTMGTGATDMGTGATNMGTGATDMGTAGTGDMNTAGPSGDMNTAGPTGDMNTAGPSGDMNTAGPTGDMNTAGPTGDMNTGGDSGNTGGDDKTGGDGGNTGGDDKTGRDGGDTGGDDKTGGDGGNTGGDGGNTGGDGGDGGDTFDDSLPGDNTVNYDTKYDKPCTDAWAQIESLTALDSVQAEGSLCAGVDLSFVLGDPISVLWTDEQLDGFCNQGCSSSLLAAVDAINDNCLKASPDVVAIEHNGDIIEAVKVLSNAACFYDADYVRGDNKGAFCFAGYLADAQDKLVDISSNPQNYMPNGSGFESMAKYCSSSCSIAISSFAPAIFPPDQIPALAPFSTMCSSSGQASDKSLKFCMPYFFSTANQLDMFTKAGLDSLCDPCVAKYILAVNSLASMKSEDDTAGGAQEEFEKFLSFACANDIDGSYCYLNIQQLIWSGNVPLTFANCNNLLGTLSEDQFSYKYNVNTIKSQKSCDAGCGGDIQGSIDAVGCCLGTLLAMSSAGEPIIKNAVGAYVKDICKKRCSSNLLSLNAQCCK